MSDVGVIGVVCGAVTLDRRVRKTPAGPLHQAVCNRWHGHEGPHYMRGRDFARLASWADKDCATPDWKAERRKQMALAKAVGLEANA